MPEKKPVSLAPLDLEKALTGLLKVKPPSEPDEPKPRAKRNKVPPTDKG